MNFLRIILWPISIVYGIIILLRNKLYDWRIFPSTKFNIPIISIGNLCVGGTGKSPQIEYLIRLLSQEFNVATLSRGYGRKTKGFLLAGKESTALEIGDEPLQFLTKFPDMPVAVDTKRVRGVKNILQHFPLIKAILLDDAFQHRSIRPGLSILLTDFSRMFSKDFVLPTGQLREFTSGVKRANIIIVTKCPDVLLPLERLRLIKEIKPLPHQSVYFSFIKYGEFLPLYKEPIPPFSKSYYFERSYSVLLLTGIANTEAIEYYLLNKAKTIIPVKFPDHHLFTVKDLENVMKIFDTIVSSNKIILTTEKDAMRLKDQKFSAILRKLPIFYVPIEVSFYEKDKMEFNTQIIDYVRKN